MRCLRSGGTLLWLTAVTTYASSEREIIFVRSTQTGAIYDGQINEQIDSRHPMEEQRRREGLPLALTAVIAAGAWISLTLTPAFFPSLVIQSEASNVVVVCTTSSVNVSVGASVSIRIVDATAPRSVIAFTI